MHFTANFTTLAYTIAAITALVVGSPAPAPEVDSADYLISNEQFYHWLANTDAEITFIGEPINPLTPRAAQNTIVNYCTRRTQNVCGGTCAVYNGGATCLAASGTNCLSATKNVGFCDHGNCNGSCNQLSSCGTRLDSGFCYTPGTNSIIVS